MKGAGRVRGTLSFLAGAFILKSVAPALSHSLWGCTPGLIFRSRCSHCWARVVKGSSVSGWVPAPIAAQLEFQRFLEAKP